MGKITTKQFQIFTDINLVWDFLVDIYDRNGGGLPAPFFEYAMSSSWMNTTYIHLYRLWFDDDKVVGFVFSEDPATDIYFEVRPGYEYLAEEMMDYAEKHMPNFGKQKFILFNGQETLMKVAEKRGYKDEYSYESYYYDFENELNRELPEGYHFVDPKEADIVKISKCCWYGFGHGEKGPFENWDAEDDSDEWTPAKSYRDNEASALAPTPHATSEYDVIIADENDEYVCFCGMWWVEKNHLAYMEPLCTVPEHRCKGLAEAALTKQYRTLKPLGATHMTGGDDPFYKKIGYGPGRVWHIFNKN